MRLKNLIVVTEWLQDDLGKLDPGNAAALAKIAAVARRHRRARGRPVR